MSKTVSLNYTDTAGGVAPTLVGPAKNYGADFAVQSNNGGIALVTNFTSPTDAPNTERYKVAAVKDIYKNTPVTESYKSPNKSGYSVLSQCNVVATILDSEDSTYRVDLPISAHLVIQGPNDSNITTTHLNSVLMRALGGLYQTDGTLRLASLVRGSMLPTDL